MNNLLNMLTKAGYEVSSIGNDVLPCTIRSDNQPIGFLMGDLSIQLLTDHEAERAKLQPIITFATENQGIEQDQGEYKLSQYQNVILTATFDYESYRPVYNIYSEDQNKEWALLNSSEVKSVATKDFVTRSGLLSSEIPEPALETSRVRQFMDAVKEKGYQFRENREEANRSYDIVDQNDKVVGYIGKNNRVTITSENSRVKQTLTSTYLDTNPNNVLLPTFFERLKEHLKDIGLALKVIFTPKGRHYAIHNEHQEVATVNEQHEVTYTDAATAEQKTKIDALIEELQEEQREQPESVKTTEAEHTKEQVQAQVVSSEDIERVANAIRSDPQMANAFFNVVLSNPEFRTQLAQEMAASVPEVDASELIQNLSHVEQKETSAAKDNLVEEQKSDQTAEKGNFEQNNSKSIDLKESFDRDYNYLQTLFGFSQEKYDALKSEMVEKYGTTNPKEFQAMLDQGGIDKASTLKGRLKNSEKVAQMKNDVRVQQEKRQEKERA